MRNRLIIYLNHQEMSALAAMVEQDFRPADAQLRYLLVNEARRRGLLADVPDPPTINEGHAVVIDAAGTPFGIQS